MTDEELVLHHINNSYIIEDKKFKDKYYGWPQWGITIIRECSLIFNVPEDVCNKILVKLWFEHDLTDEDYYGAYKDRNKLNFHWSPELAEDLNKFNNIDVQAELTALLSQYLVNEIDTEIEKPIFISSIKNINLDI